MNIKNDQREVLESIINSKTIKTRIADYSLQEIKETKNSENDDKIINSIISRIINDMQSMGINIYDNDTEHVRTNIKQLVTKQVNNARMAEKLRTSKSRIIGDMLNKLE